MVDLDRVQAAVQRSQRGRVAERAERGRVARDGGALLKQNRSFLREEVREARKTRNDVKEIATRMLETLESVALGPDP